MCIRNGKAFEIYWNCSYLAQSLSIDNYYLYPSMHEYNILVIIQIQGWDWQLIP